jgi:hypothetical protein
MLEPYKKRFKQSSDTTNYTLQRPNPITVFLRSVDIIYNWSGNNNSRFDIPLYPLLEQYTKLTLLYVSIKQIYSTPLQYLNICLIGLSQSATSKPPPTLPAQITFTTMLEPTGPKAAGTWCSYNGASDFHAPFVQLTASDMNTAQIVLMDESFQQLQWDGVTTGWEFYMVLKAEACE